MDNYQFVLLLLAALGACLAALFTFSAANATKKASRGDVLLSCLEKYISIMKDKSKAVEEKSPQWADEFYRELFDLHWSEFHIWQEGVISDRVMQSWLYIRKRNYDSDKIMFKSADGSEKSVTYKEQWDKVKSENYFEINDPFIRFMERAHSGDIADIKKFKKETRK